MEHSKNFEKIKAYYDAQLWTKEQVYNVVGKKNGISSAEYEEITNEPYEEQLWVLFIALQIT